MPARPPEQRLQRLLLLARIDALSLVIVAGPAAVVSLCGREWFGGAVGLGLALCGGLEWCGHKRLARRELSGLTWLVVAQLAGLALILLYVRSLALAPQTDRLLALLPSFTREQLDLLCPDPEELHALLAAVQRLTASLLALVAILYQGGLALYYLRARPLAQTVFAAPPVLVAPSPPV
jgi:hypothetical protein